MNTAKRWRLGGRVQGVGFRPFVYRLACRHALAGWVRNEGGEVEIHVQGPPERLRAFGRSLLAQQPPAAAGEVLDVQAVPVETLTGFAIAPSGPGRPGGAHVPTDLFACDDCLAELRDPRARRHRYPFINCTQCGPRYTVIRSLPYDRPNTTLERFALCRDCAAEYADPGDRRFHAQPLACPACGPGLVWQSLGAETAGNDAALAAAVAALRRGLIIGVRGVGGYHLYCDATSDAAVARLRLRKGRPTKPLALMVPWRGRDGLDAVRALGDPSVLEAAALREPARPIVLVRRRDDAALAVNIAPDLGCLGIMLPYSPLHHLLLDGFAGALVATSGNVGGEPVLTRRSDAVERLRGVADGFLHHDRPIARPADDPIVHAIGSVMRPLRLGRGTAPLELQLAQPLQVPTLAAGSYAKNTVALAWGRRAVVSPHIGDLDSPRGRELFAQVASDLQELYGVRAGCIAHDAHPGFPNTRWARMTGLPAIAVWHHHAHAGAVAGEFPTNEPMLCFTWDGVGLGEDGSLWGGEALYGRPGQWLRAASFRTFRLPGGDRVAREPWRAALALRWESGRGWPAGERVGGELLRRAFDADVNVPRTSSVGRLFDAAAALLGLCSHASYEGEGPALLEAQCRGGGEPVALPLVLDGAGVWRSDWEPLLDLLADERSSVADRAEGFQASLAAALCAQACAIRRQTGVLRVGLGGGVFQNRILTDRALALLAGAGFDVRIPQRLPVNDAAISFGQLIEAAAAQHAGNPLHAFA
jgi:hydrogenase maturation protein HypF